RTGFGDGFEAADKVHDAAKDKAAAKPGDAGDAPAAPGGGDAAGEDAKKDDGKPPLYKRPLVVLVAIVVIVGLVVAGVLFFMHSRSREVTDDAFVDGQASQMAAQAAGRVVRLYVTDNQQVKQGDPLVD